MLANIFLNIMEISIFTSVLIIIVMLCSKIISKKYQVGWRKVIWLLIAIRMLIPFNITLSVVPVFQMYVSEMTSEGDVNTSDSDVEETISNEEIVEGTEETITNENSESTEQISEVEVSKEDEGQKSFEADGIDTTSVEKTNVFDFNFDTGIVTVLALIWVLVALGKLLFHIVQYNQCKRLLLKNSVPCKDVFVIQQMENAMIQYELFKVPLVYWTSKIRTPMLMGYGNTMLLLPQGLRSEIRTDLEEIKLSLMIDHEMMHLKKNDLWYKLMMLLVTDIYWFHPFAYIMKYKSNQDIELCCDYQVSKQMTKTVREIYSQVILEFVSKKGYARYLYSTCMGETKQSVKERITVVFEHHKKRNSVGLIIIGIITITSVGGFVSFSHASISAVEDIVDQEVSETEELIMYTDDIENYYNYLITESSTKIYAVDSQRIYMIDKETKEIELFYTSETYNIMANKLIGKWLYFTEYNSFTDGNICRINVETAEKETVLENAVAHEISYKDREIYLKLPTEIIGYEMDSEGYLQKEIDGEEIYKLSDQAYISDAVYIEECTDGKELYYTYKDELYKNVVMYDGKEEQVLFDANNVELITPEGIYYKKDSVIGFYDFLSKQVDDHFCEDFHYLSYMNEMSTPTPTYDEEYLYYAIEKEPGITSFIRISRENGSIEEFYQIDMVESVYGISVSENILFVLCSEEDGTSLNILDTETNEWIMN